jgi:hypothetical protein
MKPILSSYELNMVVVVVMMVLFGKRGEEEGERESEKSGCEVEEKWKKI